MTTISGADVRKLVIACDAGMGTSVMLAGQLRRELRGTAVTVEHHALNSIPPDADVVLCQCTLAARARMAVPDAVVVGFRMFLGDPAVARVVAAVKQGAPVGADGA